MPNVVTVMSPFEERLASLPEIPKKRADTDGAEPSLGPTASPGEEDQSTHTLQDSDDKTTFLAIEQLIRSQDRIAKNRFAIDTYYRWTDNGIPFGRLDKIPNQAMWVAKLPPGASRENTAAVPNKANDLCNKVSEQLLADPPKPNPQAHTNNEGAKETGDLAAQFLRLNGGESGTNDVQNFRWALRSALVNGSSFLAYDYCPDKGGYQPLQLLSAANAQDPANPLVEMVPDPTTGMPIPQKTVNPILRYVSAPTPEAPAGQFVEKASEADKVWLPAIRIKRLRREQVRTFPVTATIEEADAVAVLDWCTVAEGIARWPETVGQMDTTQLIALASWRPALSEIIVPFLFRSTNADGNSGPSLDEVGTLSPIMQRRMFFYRFYVPGTPEYPSGLHIEISGSNGGSILLREPLDYTITMPDGNEETRCRDIPLVQITPVQDVTENDPFGFPFMSRFSGSSEAVSTLYAAYLDALDQRLHPHVFIYSTTPVDEDDWANRSLPIILNPGDPPVSYEQFSPLPDIVRVSEDMHTMQDVASGLTATAQGLDSSNSVSGVAKSLTVQQAKVSLSGIQQQLHQGFTRGWRICVQIAQAHFTTPQLLQYTGTDGSSEARWFRGEDLAGVDDVGIEPGTGTMMTAEGKANYVAFLQENGWLTPDRASEVALLGISRDLGLPPDPVEQAIDRAVTGWLEGPPEGWEVQEEQYQQQVMAYKQETMPIVEAHAQQSAESQMQGGPPLQTPPQLPPPPQRPWSPFSPKPNDSEPEVALKWVKRLSKLMLDPQYDAAIPQWRALVDEKYLTCRQAIQPPPMMGQPGQGQPQGGPPPQLERLAA